MATITARKRADGVRHKVQVRLKEEGKVYDIEAKTFDH